MSHDEPDLYAIAEQHLQAASAPITEILGAEGSDVLAAIRGDLGKAAQQTAAAQTGVVEILEDDQVPLEGRQRVAHERYEAGKKVHTDAAEGSLDRIEVLERKLQQAATPPLPDDARQVGLMRDELKMILDASDDPAAMATAIAQGPDRTAAAVIVSTWGSRYLQSRGIKGLDDALRTAAVEGAERHGTKKERAAGKALKTALIDLKKGRDAYYHANDARLEDAGRPLGRK